ncbi:MAG: DUF692 domain-containing protein [Gammaproteobacteria bacterium]|nr:DUF692 domain-containing protein [Gammaproteobacteria bacterium]MCP5459428.1 DUF692 domain-containing protein [Gammaproteobacteria bacterium]
MSGLGPNPIPARAGVGLRSGHYREMLETLPPVGWLEAHPENFFAVGGKHLHYLEQLRAHYPLSLHGVGLSIGSTDPLNTRHLDKLKRLIERFEPALVSEHVSWGSVNGRYFNDLLPLPYTEEALAHMVTRVSQIQDYLGRAILVENVSSYLQYESSTIPEWEFVAALAERAGCGLLLDVNNIYVNACNHDFDASTYVRAIPAGLVQEIHLAGFTVNTVADRSILIDTHSRPVCDDVWSLYRQTVQHLGAAVPTLIEWDSDLPPLDVLVGEARHADALLDECHGLPA